MLHDDNSELLVKGKLLLKQLGSHSELLLLSSLTGSMSLMPLVKTPTLYVDYNKCVEEPGFCLNGATCEQTWTTTNCHCTNGFQGDRCDTCPERFQGDDCQQCSERFQGAVARNVPLVSKVMIVRNVYRTTTGMTAVIIFNCFYYDYYIFLNKTLLPHRNDDCKTGVSHQK